ncbi:MAG: co-chaperone DjlA [Legionella sp.]|uniref:co-chaperone DjlA n=1 Tax=Legionella sp. TaxID=459 RepID=UPI0039E24FDC
MNFKKIFTANSWWGKFIGAFIGYCIAGPIGILLGLFAGTLFTRRLSLYYANPHWSYFQERNAAVQKAFFETTFSIMGYLAKTDGRITTQEIELARSVMREMHLKPEQKLVAIHLFNEGKSPHFNLREKLAQLLIACRSNRELLKLFINIQYQMAQVDSLTTRKIQVLDMIFTSLGFAPIHKQYRFYEDFGFNYSHTQNQNETHQSSSESYSSYSKYNYKPSKTNLDHAYALIEVSPNANQQEVKRAYRRLLSRNHPDKLIAQGLPQEMIKIANEKTQKIVKAYESICESKGW